MAEPVDRGDVGGAQLLQRQQQLGAQTLVPLGWHLLQPLPQLLIKPLVAGRIRGLEQQLGLLQPPADPVPEFGGRGIGEGDHQQGSQGQLPLPHQPQHQMGECEGLAGAGTGLDQVHPWIQRQTVGRQLRRLGCGAGAAHGFSCCSSRRVHAGPVPGRRTLRNRHAAGILPGSRGRS